MKQALTSDSNYLREVREQYENYPYPPRDPQQELKRFLAFRTGSFDCLNYYHYSGKRDFSKGFRALIAGGGTGDSTIALAEQCRGINAEIIHLDLSASSLEIAQARAKIRGLSNITWVHGSLLDAPQLLDGPFDFIESQGVLHHLANPEEGLAALSQMLRDDGVLCLMLYATYGRESVYQMQNLMQILNKGEASAQQRVDNCKTVMSHLPSTNRIADLPPKCEDLQSFGDVGIYDMFLHSQDRAYTVAQVYDFVASSGLVPTHFFFDMQKEGNDLYNLEHYLGESELSDAVRRLPLREKQAAAELMHGDIFKHAFYAAKRVPAVPSLHDLDNVPFFYMTMRNDNYQRFAEFLREAPVGETFEIEHHYNVVSYSNTPHLALMCGFMDGHKSLAEIFDAVIAASDTKPDVETLLGEFKSFFAAFNKKDMIFLRHKSVPKTVTIDDIAANTPKGESFPASAYSAGTFTHK